jgi:hypothetical protein
MRKRRMTGRATASFGDPLAYRRRLAPLREALKK